MKYRRTMTIELDGDKDAVDAAMFEVTLAVATALSNHEIRGPLTRTLIQHHFDFLDDDGKIIDMAVIAAAVRAGGVEPL